jgi:UDP-glucose 4-epimerase
VKILVTGSEGSLMQSVIPYLLSAGHQVRGADNFFRYGFIGRGRAYEFTQANLADPGLARDLTTDVDVVIQAAARIFGVTGFHRVPADILAHDTTLHQNLLWGALKNGVRRFVYISSSMVYERSEKVPSREEDVAEMPIPQTDYGLSKLVGERLCRAFERQYGLAFTVWRPFNIITPHEKSEGEPGISHVFADFIERIAIDCENPMRILGDGQQVRCFTWIEDVARAIAEYLLSPETENEVYNIGNPEPVTMRELAEKIHQKARRAGLISDGGPLEFQHLPAFEDDVRIRIPSIEKASTRLAWKPSISLDQALDRCLEHARLRRVSAHAGDSALAAS